MINSGVFNSINVLGKAADAAWLRNEAITNNIANASTPNYKRQDVTFEKELQRALRHSKYTSLSQKIGDVSVKNLEPRTYSDTDSFSYRLDGNNVDPQTENVMLAKNQIKYNALIQTVNQTFTGLKAAMK